jgi:hypothetical protein
MHKNKTVADQQQYSDANPFRFPDAAAVNASAPTFTLESLVSRNECFERKVSSASRNQ